MRQIRITETVRCRSNRRINKTILNIRMVKAQIMDIHKTAIQQRMVRPMDITHQMAVSMEPPMERPLPNRKSELFMRSLAKLKWIPKKWNGHFVCVSKRRISNNSPSVKRRSSLTNCSANNASKLGIAKSRCWHQTRTYCRCGFFLSCKSTFTKLSPYHADHLFKAPKLEPAVLRMVC